MTTRAPLRLRTGAVTVLLGNDAARRTLPADLVEQTAAVAAATACRRSSG